MSNDVLDSPLGKPTEYHFEYDPSLLFAIPRFESRINLNIKENLPFGGVDIWNSYELSWLNAKGKPQIAIVMFIIPCTSPNIIESKSFKLYLNSLSQTRFDTHQQVLDTIRHDVEPLVGCAIELAFIAPEDMQKIESFPGQCLDDLELSIDNYQLSPHVLHCGEKKVSETLYSNLLKSNCPITGQPDWASVLIRYEGQQINHQSLLKYLITYRNHSEFHEQCVERIFTDIQSICQPEKLTVYARYTRRGGLDINPFRSNFEATPANISLFRQ